VRFRDGQQALDYFFGPEPADAAGAYAASSAASSAAAAAAAASSAAGSYPPCEDLTNFVVLLDLKMPRVDGFEVLRRLKESPRTAAVPVIVLTTTDDQREIARCYELGCNVYICKPVEYDAFIEAVRRLGFFLQVVKLPSGHRLAAP
jgi:CheY-like chemotaxis protein